MKFESKVVHAGDRKKAGNFIPSVTPIYTASSYVYESLEQLDRVSRRKNPDPILRPLRQPDHGRVSKSRRPTRRRRGRSRMRIRHGRAASLDFGRADRSAQARRRRQHALRRDDRLLMKSSAPWASKPSSPTRAIFRHLKKRSCPQARRGSD